MPNKKNTRKKPTTKSATKKKSTAVRSSSLVTISRFNKRAVAVFFVVLFAAVGTYFILQSQAAAPELKKFVNNKEKGLFWDDLEEAPAGSKCNGLLVPKNPAHKRDVRGEEVCTHGPDPAPDGIDVRDKVEPIRTGEDDATSQARPGVAYAQTTSASSLPCEGDGQSGNRVQFLYIRASDQPNRYSSFSQSLQAWAANADASFTDSAVQTGGVRHLRIVTDANCQAVIPNVTVSATGDDNWTNTVAELRTQGYNRTDRKYMLYVDANIYCGISEIRSDDQPGSGNTNNFGPSYARVDNGCWAHPLSVAHELMHTLGGVQQSAPHKTARWHCTDDYDLMCYDDTSSFGLDAQIICPDKAQNNRIFDCNKDDYFHTSPVAGSYLATRWNTANNVFLSTNNNVVALPAHPTGCTPGPDYALIYSQTNFGGTCKTLALGYGYPTQAELQPVPHINSVRVGENVKFTTCWDTNFRGGGCDTYSADAATLIHPSASQSAYLSLRSGSGDPTPPPPPPSDTIAPSVSISQPNNGAIIRNTTPISATGADNVGVTQMEIYVDGQLKATSTTSSISYSWNSKKASRGSHTIIVKAKDAAGHIGQASISVNK